MPGSVYFSFEPRKKGLEAVFLFSFEPLNGATLYEQKLARQLSDGCRSDRGSLNSTWPVLGFGFPALLVCDHHPLSLYPQR